MVMLIHFVIASNGSYKRLVANFADIFITQRQYTLIILIDLNENISPEDDN